jgi:hypothetical protein
MPKIRLKPYESNSFNYPWLKPGAIDNQSLNGLQPKNIDFSEWNHDLKFKNCDFYAIA